MTQTKVPTTNAGEVVLEGAELHLGQGRVTGTIALQTRFGSEVHRGLVSAWAQPDGTYRLGTSRAFCNSRMVIVGITDAPVTCEKCSAR